MKRLVLTLAAASLAWGCGSADDNEQSYSYLDAEGVQHFVNLRDFQEESLDALKEKLGIEGAALGHIWQKLDKPAPASIDWRSLQTPIRNQKNRNTCTGFAKVAGIEARYSRDFKVKLDLSEQYFWHTYKSTGVAYPAKKKRENASSYWGGGGVANLDSAKEYAIPLETDLPYLDKGQMNTLREKIPAAGALVWKASVADDKVTQAEVDAFEYSPLYIPAAVRYKAKYGVKSYTSLSEAEVRDTAKLEKILAAGNEVIVMVNLKWKANADGIMDWDSTASNAYHAFLLVGYDRAKDFFWVKNSWGGSEFLRVTYKFMKNGGESGAFITAVRDPEKEVNPKGRMLGNWNFDHDGWKGKLVIRRSTNPKNEATRLGHYTESGKAPRAVNGEAVEGNRGIRMSIADVEFNEPGDMNGKIYTTYGYSAGESYAAGISANEYGAFMTRTSETSKYGKDFSRSKWIGNWALNHNGLKGTLSITGFQPIGPGPFGLRATYKDAQGNAKPVSGELRPGKDHQIYLRIKFSDSDTQNFSLFFHTWTENLISGIKIKGESKYGVHGFKI